MATGIIKDIKSVNGNLKTGTIKSDETGDDLIFENQNIACDIDDKVNYSLKIVENQGSIATDVTCAPTAPAKHPDHPIKGKVTKDIIVGPGEKLVVKDGGEVTGQVIIQGGKLRIDGGGIVTGQVIIQKSGNMINNGTLNGDVSAEEVELLKIGGGGIVTGQVIIQNGHKMVMDGGQIQQGLEVQTAFKVIIQSKSKIGKVS
jgi:hypothetical protein